MSSLTGVQLGPSQKVQYFDANGLPLTVGDRVIVETGNGAREGIVVIAPEQVLLSDLRGPLNPVLRKSLSA